MAGRSGGQEGLSPGDATRCQSSPVCAQAVGARPPRASVWHTAMCSRPAALTRSWESVTSCPRVTRTRGLQAAPLGPEVLGSLPARRGVWVARHTRVLMVPTRP